MNRTNNLIEPKLYMNPTKNLIELKLYMVATFFTITVHFVDTDEIVDQLCLLY